MQRLVHLEVMLLCYFTSASFTRDLQRECLEAKQHLYALSAKEVGLTEMDHVRDVEIKVEN